MIIWIKNYRIDLNKVLYIRHFNDAFEFVYETRTILIANENAKDPVVEPDISINSTKFSILHKILDKAMKPYEMV